MVDQISAREFHESDGVEDWRVLGRGACAYFRTGSFAVGAQLVDAIAEIADAANHHPDLDLRFADLTVRLISHDIGGLSKRDLALARQISEAARELDVPADPSELQDVDLTVDALSREKILPFWQAVLAYRKVGEEDLVDRHGRWASVWFQQLDAPRPQRNRIHVDVWVPHDQSEARVAAAIAAGGHLVNDEHAPGWWTLADEEGNEVDVVTWLEGDTWLEDD